MTLVLFDAVYSVEYLSKPLADVVDLDATRYVPGGFTALLDAVGSAIDTLGESLSQRADEDRPDKVIVVIITDGLENASKEYTLASVRSRIEHQQRQYKWQFLFLGANIDAFAEARSLGIQSRHAAQYTASRGGTRSVGESISKGVSSYRGTGAVVMDWNKNVK